MGRSRRRNRRETWTRANHDASAEPAPAVAAELAMERRVSEPRPMLTPTYVSVGPTAWAAESDAPVLPLEGLQPWDAIRGPALALVEEPGHEELPADSSDPAQLELVPAVQPHAAPEPQRSSDDRAVALATIIAADRAAAVADTAVAEAPEALAEPEPEPPPRDPVEERFEEARAAADAGRRGDAIQAYRQILAQRPLHVRARNNLALLLETEGNTEAALAEYDRALDLEPDNPILLVNRGSLLGQMGRYAAAERDLKRVLRVEPSHVDGLFALGVVLTKKALWSEAVAPLRHVVELEPLRGPAHFYLGEALNHVDDLPGALAAYQRAAELMPEHPRALYGLGIVFDRMGRPDDAARMYRKSRDVARR